MLKQSASIEKLEHGFALETSLVQKLREFSVERGAAIKDVLQTAFACLLQYTTNKTDLTFGLITHGRPDIADGDRIVGAALCETGDPRFSLFNIFNAAFCFFSPAASDDAR